MVITNEEHIKNKKIKIAKVRKQAKKSYDLGALTTYFILNGKKYFWDSYRNKLFKFDKEGRNYKYAKSLETPYDYEPLYHPQTGLPYHTTPYVKLQKAKFNLKGEETPHSLKDFYDTLKVYWRRTYGDYIRLQNGKIKINKNAKGKMNYVNLAFKETYGGNQVGTVIWRAIRVSNWKDFSKQVNKILSSQTISGSDEVPEGYDLDTSTFELRNMAKPKLLITGNGSNIKLPYNPHYTFKDCNENYCSVACVKSALGIKKHLTTLVKELEEEVEDLENGISLENLNVLENYFQVNINVYDWNEKDLILRPSLTDYDKDVNLILYMGKEDYLEGHYVLRTGFRKEKKKKVVKEKQPVKEFFLFYDLETTYNKYSFNVLEPYSCAWFLWEKGKEFSYNPKMLKDCHYVDIREGNPLKIFLEWIYSNQTGAEYDGVFHKHKFIITGFNNSRFDNFFLIDEAIKSDMVKNILFVQNSILNFNMGRHSSLDLCRFIATSLKNACESFKTNPEKLEGFSHQPPQEAFEKGRKEGLIRWITQNEELLIKYNKFDVLSLADLTFKYDKANRTLLNNIDFSESNTISGLSWESFNHTNEFDIYPPRDMITDTQIRKSLTAGRTQCYFGRNKFNMDLRMVDVVSLYPFVMMNRKFPIGDYTHTDEYQPNKLGIYSCEIIHQNLKWKNPDKIKKSFENFKNIDIECYNRITDSQKKYAPIVYPKRSDDEPLDWNYRGKMLCYLSSIDIENIRDYGGEVKIIKNWEKENGEFCSGIYWEEDTEEVFKTFLGKCMEEKNRQDELKKASSEDYNPALREACKLVSNSLSGKVIQRNFEEVMMFLKDSKSLQKFLDKTIESTQIIEFFGDNVVYGKGKLKEEHIYKEQKAKPSYLGIFIYSHARNYMYKTLLGSYTCIYQDTDSALLPLWEYERLIQEKGELFPFNRNKKYGDLEEEVGEANLAYTIAPKCYSVLNTDDEIARESGTLEYKNKCHAKRKFKGIKMNDKWELFNYKNKKEFRKNYLLKDDEIINKLSKEKNVFTKGMMEHLFNQDKIMIYTSQLVKQVKDSGIEVKNDSILREDGNKNKNVSFRIYQRYMIKII